MSDVDWLEALGGISVLVICVVVRAFVVRVDARRARARSRFRVGNLIRGPW